VNDSTIYTQTTRMKCKLEEALCTDGSVEKAEKKSKNDESSIPVACAGYGCYAQIHEDDRLCH